MAKKVAGDLYEIITGQLFEIGRQLRQKSGYPFDPEQLKQHLQNAIEGHFISDPNKKSPYITHTLHLSVNYSRTVEKGVKAGKYDWKNENITPHNFPSDTKGEKEVDIHILHFNKAISSYDAIQEMDKQGLRPANLQELLSLGETFPDLQKEFSLVALGSVWVSPDGCRDVPVLWGDGAWRGLGLRWFDDGWLGFYRFLAVRKSR